MVDLGWSDVLHISRGLSSLDLRIVNHRIIRVADIADLEDG